MTVSAVIFDWGGTLTPTLAVLDIVDIWRAAARHLAPDREEQLTAALVDVEAQSWKRVETTQESATLAALLAAASGALGLDVTDAVLEEAATHHLDAWTPHVQHDPQAAEVLQEVRDRGLPIGLLSNTHWPRAFHEHFLERDGLDDLIDVRCYTSELPFTKPHPSAFATVLDRLGVQNPSEAVFVGDRPFDDIHGARGAGMRTVLRPNDSVPPYDVVPDAVISSLPELLSVLDAWS